MTALIKEYIADLSAATQIVDSVTSADDDRHHFDGYILCMQHDFPATRAEIY